MTFTEICKDPKAAGRIAFNSGMSIHANPFRNTHGHSAEYSAWQEGHTEARNEANMKLKANDNIS